MSNCHAISLQVAVVKVLLYQQCTKNNFVLLLKIDSLWDKPQSKYKKCTSAPSKTICWWFSEFRYAHTSTDDDALSGHPIEISTPTSTKEIYCTILDDWNVQVKTIGNIVKIWTEPVKNILQMRMWDAKLVNISEPLTILLYMNCI